MSAPQNFRSSFNGFNREDGVRYIEYLNSRHRSQMDQLTGELDYLRHQLEQYQNGPTAAAELEALQAQCASMQAQLEESLSIRCALEARCNGRERELEEAVAARKEAEQAHSATRCHIEQELEAYRRAERMERMARERAELVYSRTNGILADATAQVDGVADQIGALADTVMQQLEQLKGVVGTSKEALKSAADSLYGLRPEEE